MTVPSSYRGLSTAEELWVYTSEGVDPHRLGFASSEWSSWPDPYRVPPPTEAMLLALHQASDAVRDAFGLDALIPNWGEMREWLMDLGYGRFELRPCRNGVPVCSGTCGDG